MGSEFMIHFKGTVTSITADEKKIHFQYEANPGADKSDLPLLLYIFEPCESEILVRKSPVEVVADHIKDKEKTFTISIDRFHDGKDRLYSKFKICSQYDDCRNGEFFEGVCYVTAFSNISMYEYDYPEAPTIKGLQVRMVDDAVKLGVKHAALNLNLPSIALPCKSDNTITYAMDGEKFYFDKTYLQRFDKQVKTLSDNGMIVTLILLNSIRWDDTEIHPDLRQALLHPDYNAEGRISAFNVATVEGLKYYKAFVEFVAERYTRPDEEYGKAVGFIIGNEVNTHWVWSNAGEKTVKEYAGDYSIALRTAYYAARKKYCQARVYISVDHFWTLAYDNNPARYFGCRQLLDILNALTVKEGNYDWSVAHHPYPENLLHPDFWNDKTAAYSYDTGRITFKNLEVLTGYLSKRDFLFEGRIRHIILSEQGFHSEESEEGEKLQAAAYCLAYKKIESLPGIDSFILHAHVDNKGEYDTWGLNLGLWTRDKASDDSKPQRPKLIYDAFRDIDAPHGDKVCEACRDYIGNKNWDTCLQSKKIVECE
jgi:hypothetical protein